jgi:DNA-binding NtrC family response regulator
MSDRICLVVDDDPAIRRYFRTILERRQLHVLETEDAPHAFRLIQKFEGRIALLVSEIEVAGEMNGVDLAYCVRDAFPAIPVILVSKHWERSSRKAGGFHLIEMPLVPEMILKTVEDLVVN